MKVLMVSTHPTSGGGVSSYTKSIVRSLREHGVDVVVFSNKPEKTRLQQDFGGIHACWIRGTLYPLQIFKALAANVDVDMVHVQHEFFLYGGMFSAIIFPVLLALIHLLGKPVVVTVHGVIPLYEFNERFKEENELKGPFLLLKFGLILLTREIVFLSDAVVVHASFFAKILVKDYKCPERKVHVVPHGVEEKRGKTAQDEAKDKLGLNDKKVILFFGYITKYKGIETLIEGFARVANQFRDLILVIGGGAHPRLRSNRHYAEYLSELQKSAISAASQGRILFTGFIPEDELPLYLSAADIMVFPYTAPMASSGPLSFAMSYGKAVVASDIPSFAEIIPLEDALFRRNSPGDLADKLERMLNSSALRDKVSNCIKIRAKEHSWQAVGSKTYELYQELLFTQANS